MATMARIENGIVAEVLTAVPFPPFHESLVWVDCSTVAGVGEGWTYNGGAFAAPEPPAPTEASCIASAQQLLDTTSQGRGYDSMLSLASYVNSTNATFKAEAVAGAAWRDAVWAEGYNILAQVQAGTLAVATMDAFLALLPAMVWPS